MSQDEHPDDEASLPQEHAAYWRFRARTSRALFCVAAALLVSIVFREPLRWGDGKAATALYYGAQIALWIAVTVAYVSNARMAERRGFMRGRFRRSPSERRGPAP